LGTYHAHDHRPCYHTPGATPCIPPHARSSASCGHHSCGHTPHPPLQCRTSATPRDRCTGRGSPALGPARSRTLPRRHPGPSTSASSSRAAHDRAPQHKRGPANGQAQPTVTVNAWVPRLGGGAPVRRQTHSDRRMGSQTNKYAPYAARNMACSSRPIGGGRQQTDAPSGPGAGCRRCAAPARLAGGRPRSWRRTAH
jgi:hypothetical protein